MIYIKNIYVYIYVYTTDKNERSKISWEIIQYIIMFDQWVLWILWVKVSKLKFTERYYDGIKNIISHTEIIVQRVSYD